MENSSKKNLKTNNLTLFEALIPVILLVILLPQTPLITKDVIKIFKKTKMDERFKGYFNNFIWIST